jgi:GTP-binding protein
MEITEAKYVASYPTVTKCPPPNKPEYAFIGRSNVGKSSLLNMFCNHKGLAKTSSKPGKTQMINYFDINQKFYFVDLPGYGYAKISKTQRKKWRSMIENYLLQRTSLACACILIDANIPPQEIDLEFLDWGGKVNLPIVIIFTKADKSKPEKVEKNILAFKEKMLENWEEMPKYFVTSANEGELGKGEFLEFVNSINEEFYNLFEAE